MFISANLKNSRDKNEAAVATEGNEKTIIIPSKANGKGSAVNGGELLFLAIATCFCNDIYREASKRNIDIESVDVTVTGEFGGEGEPGNNIEYNVSIESKCPEEKLRDLVNYVDSIAEIHKTIRSGTPVRLSFFK
ncbi:OsmC family protein [Flavitalea sp.]|nr:OsmC family protein [Flavitalea sp.]